MKERKQMHERGKAKKCHNGGCGIMVYWWVIVWIVFQTVHVRGTGNARKPARQLPEIRLIEQAFFNRTVWLVQHQDQMGAWSSVCVDGPLTPSVRVACRQFGYITGVLELFHGNDEYSSANESMFHIDCTGLEEDLATCWTGSKSVEMSKNCTRLQVHCSDDPDTERGVRIINRISNYSSSGIVQIYDTSANEWSFVCSQNFLFSETRLICLAYGMALNDSKSEPFSSWMFEAQQTRSTKALNCNFSAASIEDCWLETVEGECNDVIYIVCKNSYDTIVPPAFIAPHTSYDLSNIINIKGLPSIDLEVKTCSGLKIALASNKESPLHDFTELEFGAVHNLQLRRCTAVDSCVFLDTLQYNTSFSCGQWMVVHLITDNDYIMLGIGPKYIVTAPPMAPVLAVNHQFISFSHPFQTEVLLPASSSHTVTYKLVREMGLNKCFIRNDIGETFEQCGDVYVSKSLCHFCGCCFNPFVRPSCYQPIGFEISNVTNLLCNRTAFQIFGTVLAATTEPVYTKRPMYIALGLQRVTPNTLLTVSFGDGTTQVDIPKIKNKNEIPTLIAEQFGSLYMMGLKYFSLLKHIYNNSGHYTMNVSVTDPKLLKSPSNISLAQTVEVQTLQPLKEIIELFYLLNNGPSCAKCVVSLYVLSQGYTKESITTVDPGDGTGPQIIDMLKASGNLSDWVIEIMRQIRFLVSMENLFWGTLDYSYNTSGQYLAEAVIREPDRDEKDFVKAKTIITVDLRPHLTPIIGTVALFNNGPVYQQETVSLVLIIEYLTPNAKVVICEGNEMLFSNVLPMAGQEIPAWIKDEVVAYPLIGNRTDYLLVELNYTFGSSGAHILEARIWDVDYDDIITIHTEVIVEQLPCDDRELKIHGGGGVAKENAVKLKQKDFIKLSIEINLDCSISGPISYGWIVTYFGSLSMDSVGKSVQLPPEATVTLHELFIPQFTLDVGYFKFDFQLTIPTTNPHYLIKAYNQTWVHITYSPQLSLSRIGILRNIAGLDSVITLAASHLLKVEETVTSQQYGDNITYAWFCTPEDVFFPHLHLLNDTFPESKGCFGTGLRLPQEDPVLVFKTDQLLFNQTSLPIKFQFHLFATQVGEESRSASHQLMIIADSDPAIRITCVSNCLPKVNTKEELVLKAVCYKNCRYGEVLKYEWQFNQGSSKNLKREINWETETDGNNATSLIVKANVFPREARGESYSFAVIVTKPNGLMGSESYPVNIPVETGAWIESAANVHHLLYFKVNSSTLILFAVLCQTLLTFTIIFSVTSTLFA